ncbi:hypothetical protein SALCHL_000291 [Streptomyces albus subsp. chlorinus]|uniref:hypothetical protein n=1 Tax=Streptomyces albus TaxID=1888 RepID=UPI00156D592E|nr:hypothetical protein [Streptomyces albus]
MTQGADTSSADAQRDPREAANEAIRRFVHGRTVWTPEALRELDRLRSRWQETHQG